MILKFNTKANNAPIDNKNLRLKENTGKSRIELCVDRVTPIVSGGFDYTLNFSFQ